MRVHLQNIEEWLPNYRLGGTLQLGLCLQLVPCLASATSPTLPTMLRAWLLSLAMYVQLAELL